MLRLFLYLTEISHWFFYEGLIVIQVSIATDNGLALIRHQPITWNNADSGHWRMIVAFPLPTGSTAECSPIIEAVGNVDIYVFC